MKRLKLEAQKRLTEVCRFGEALRCICFFHYHHGVLRCGEHIALCIIMIAVMQAAVTCSHERNISCFFYCPDDEEQAKGKNYSDRERYQPGLYEAGDYVGHEGDPCAGERVGQLGRDVVDVVALRSRR